jgi:hypothetical protein
MFAGNKKKKRNFFRKAQIAPYQARRFRNPYFHTQTKLPAWPLILVGLGLGLVVALSSFFLTSPLFTLSSIRVEGAETVNPKAIRDIAEDYLSNRSFFVFKNNNRFFFNGNELQSCLEKQYSFANLSIVLEKQSVAITLKEKVSSFLWISGDKSYLLDETGAVIRGADPDEIKSLLNPPLIQGPTKNGGLIPETIKILIFKDLESKTVIINSTVMSENEVKNTRLFFEIMYQAGIVIEKFELNRSVGSWLRANTRQDFDILFDPNEDVLEQADKILLLLRDQIKDPAALEYIDVRFGDRVYYK